MHKLSVLYNNNTQRYVSYTTQRDMEKINLRGIKISFTAQRYSEKLILITLQFTACTYKHCN